MQASTIFFIQNAVGLFYNPSSWITGWCPELQLIYLAYWHGCGCSKALAISTNDGGIISKNVQHTVKTFIGCKRINNSIWLPKACCSFLSFLFFCSNVRNSKAQDTEVYSVPQSCHIYCMQYMEFLIIGFYQCPTSSNDMLWGLLQESILN